MVSGNLSRVVLGEIEAAFMQPWPNGTPRRFVLIATVDLATYWRASPPGERREAVREELFRRTGLPEYQGKEQQQQEPGS